MRSSSRPPTGANNIVAIRNKTRTQQYYMGFTERIDRPREVALRRLGVVWGGAARGEARPIAAWYPPESSDGLKFIYRR